MWLTSLTGQEYGVPRLWAFFGLSQILPISFAQNLFYLALLCQPQQSKPKPDSPSLPLTVAFTLPLVISYGACLGVAESSAGTDTLILIILATRVLLMAPMLLPSLGKLGFGRLGREAQLAVVALSAVMIGNRILGDAPEDFMRALTSRPAVSALGFDFVLSVVSYLLWTSLDPKPLKSAGIGELAALSS